MSPFLEQLWIFIAFTLVGIAAGFAQMRSARECPCCRGAVSRHVERCPRCHCRVG